MATDADIPDANPHRLLVRNVMPPGARMSHIPANAMPTMAMATTSRCCRNTAQVMRATNTG